MEPLGVGLDGSAAPAAPWLWAIRSLDAAPLEATARIPFAASRIALEAAAASLLEVPEPPCAARSRLLSASAWAARAVCKSPDCDDSLSAVDSFAASDFFNWLDCDMSARRAAVRSAAFRAACST